MKKFIIAGLSLIGLSLVLITSAVIISNGNYDLLFNINNYKSNEYLINTTKVNTIEFVNCELIDITNDNDYTVNSFTYYTNENSSYSISELNGVLTVRGNIKENKFDSFEKGILLNLSQVSDMNIYVSGNEVDLRVEDLTINNLTTNVEDLELVVDDVVANNINITNNSLNVNNEVDLYIDELKCNEFNLSAKDSDITGEDLYCNNIVINSTELDMLFEMPHKQTEYTFLVNVFGNCNVSTSGSGINYLSITSTDADVVLKFNN